MVRGKLSEKFSKSATETYQYLEGLKEKTWSTYGLFQFKIGAADGFIIQGELDPEDPDQFFILKNGQILRMSFDDLESNEFNGEVINRPKFCLKKGKAKKPQHFRRFGQDMIIVRMEKCLEIYKANPIINPKDGLQYDILLSSIDLEPQYQKQNSAHLQFGTDKNQIFVIKGEKQLVKLRFDEENQSEKLHVEGTYESYATIHYFKAINNSADDEQSKLVVWCKQDPKDSGGYLQLIRQSDMQDDIIDGERFSNEVKADTGPISTMIVGKQDLLFTGMDTDAYDILIWQLMPQIQQMKKVGLQFHTTKITALMMLDDQYLISGAAFDGRLAIWKIQPDKKQKIQGMKCGQIDCKGEIKNLFMKDNDELVVQSSAGIFVFDDVNMARFKKFPLRKDGKLMTSSNICIFNDGLRYAAGYDKY